MSDCLFVGPGGVFDPNTGKAVRRPKMSELRHDGWTPEMWADALDKARIDMMTLEDWEPSDVAAVMTECSAVIRRLEEEVERLKKQLDRAPRPYGGKRVANGFFKVDQYGPDLATYRWIGNLHLAPGQYRVAVYSTKEATE